MKKNKIKQNLMASSDYFVVSWPGNHLEGLLWNNELKRMYYRKQIKKSLKRFDSLKKNKTFVLHKQGTVERLENRAAL